MTAAPTARGVRGTYGDYEVLGPAISKGGVGSIFRTTDPKWVYKQYHSPDKAPSSDHLQRLVSIGREVLIRQGQPIGSRPESSINWPIDIVRQPDGRIIGCILPAIPDSYFHKEHKGVNTLDFLVMRRSSPPAAKFRMVVLLRMAEILSFVHSKGLVHGDVNAKNVAWTLDPEPAAYLIDCDGMVPQDPPPKTGVQASYWTDPRVIDRVIPAHDHYSDWYCLALAFYRGLLLPQGGSLGKRNGIWAEPGQIPADLDPRITALLRRGLTNPLDPSRRPEPAEWAKILIEVYVKGDRYDEPALARLDRALIAPKMTATTPSGQFTIVPPVSTLRTSPPKQPTYTPPQPTYQPPPQPVYQPPPQPTYQPPQPTFRTPPPPPQPQSHLYQGINPNPYPGNSPYPAQRQPGAFARWAMGGGAGWYLPLVLITMFFSPVAVILFGITVAQVSVVSSDHPRRMGALISSGIGAGVGAFLLLVTFASKLS